MCFKGGVSTFAVYIHLISGPIYTSSLLVLHYRIKMGNIRLPHRNARRNWLRNRRRLNRVYKELVPSFVVQPEVTPWDRVPLEKLVVSHVIEKFMLIVKHEGFYCFNISCNGILF
jgi:hypothetical protein